MARSTALETIRVTALAFLSKTWPLRTSEHGLLFRCLTRDIDAVVKGGAARGLDG